VNSPIDLHGSQEGSRAVEVQGSGSAVLIPRCNFEWDQAVIDALAGQFTVIVASPRGFGRSARLQPPDTYDLATLERDLLEACDEAGFSRFSVLGYSFASVVALLLANSTGRVDAVIAGGFPYGGGYSNLSAYVENNIHEIQGPGTYEVPDGNFDSRALVAIYRHLATLPESGLITHLRCPLLAFWGSDDEVVGMADSVEAQQAAADAEGATTVVLEGLDHDGALAEIPACAPQIVKWLDTQLARQQ